MKFEMVFGYILSLLYALVCSLNAHVAIKAFKDGRYGAFGFNVSLFILNIFMMARMIFIETV